MNSVLGRNPANALVDVAFNRAAPKIGNSIPEPSQELIEASLNLRQASLEDAARYGGAITREALGAMNLRGDRKYVIVDTKIHLLMPGWVPAIPGWHTDGVPRGEENDFIRTQSQVYAPLDFGW